MFIDIPATVMEEYKRRLEHYKVPYKAIPFFSTYNQADYCRFEFGDIDILMQRKLYRLYADTAEDVGHPIKMTTLKTRALSKCPRFEDEET